MTTIEFACITYSGSDYFKKYFSNGQRFSDFDSAVVLVDRAVDDYIKHYSDQYTVLHSIAKTLRITGDYLYQVVLLSPDSDFCHMIQLHVSHSCEHIF